LAEQKHDVLLAGPLRPVIAAGLANFTTHNLPADCATASLTKFAPMRAMVVTAMGSIDDRLLAHLPQLEIIASFGVGYDHVDALAAARRGITVTNTPDVLTEEVADTALGLLIATVRELPQAERYVRAGKWREANYPLSRATLRNRTVGLVGMGRIGQAIAHRLDAFAVPVVYHSRTARPDFPYRHYADLLEMAAAVDVLIAIVPGGAATRNMIDARVLAALGPDGIFINVARGSVVDETALIAALKEGRIQAAGLDVFTSEPEVPAELLTMDNVVLLPHVGSASRYTREKMDQLVVDNILAWAAGKPPLTPVAETPWRSWRTA
jgi:lactate dehydrogenase-like 2-hydroxyacid dehydrogenase